MRKSKLENKSLLFLIIVISLFLVPLFALNSIRVTNTKSNKNEIITINQLSPLFSNNNKNYNEYLNTRLTGTGSILDVQLKEFLLNTSSLDESNISDLKVIVLFEAITSKKERVGIIKSIFEEYDILANYDIIPGLYLRINPNQLLNKLDLIEESTSITRIYKSQIYKSPYISGENLEINALNENFYSNWWLSSIEADNLTYDGTGVKVAVIDTGVYDHPSLNIIENRNFVVNESSNDYEDDVGHGTHVAGIIAGDGSGSSGEYRGVAPGALIINARAGNESGLEEGDIIEAIDWSSRPTADGGAGADIISMSFGGGDASISDSITQAISYAKNIYGVMFVASAGNSGPKYFTGSTPATGVDVIAVGATDKDDELASFSSRGPTFGYIGYPDVVAPGVNIISAEAPRSSISKEKRYKGDFFDFSGDADYIPLSGTSMACPVVSGALAILIDAFPDITPETARIALLEGARKLSNENDGDIVKSGAGMINISASLDYLNNLPVDYNDIAKIYPDEMPIKPFDLLNFPGDHQKFNLTVLSGNSNSFTIEIPSDIQGISLSIDKSILTFSDSGIDFIELDVQVRKDAIPGARRFQLNLTKDGQIYAFVNFILEIRLPEYNILMESYHGLNDWFPELSFYQMGFYEAISDLTSWNLTVDYLMEYWTPDYDKNYNNSILTEERLAQYDLVVLQNPILPYSPLEIANLRNYFENGGNILFLGTRYQDLIVENVNHLFLKLGINVEINEENIMDEEWLGVGASLDSQSVSNFENPLIFQNVSKFKWWLGNSFSVSDDAESIATINNKTVVAMYNGTSQGKGRFLGFGDLNWLFDEYESSEYSHDHSNLLKNIVDYFMPKEEVSINVGLKNERISNSRLDFSLYLKNQTTESPITNSDYESLTLIIENESYSEEILLNMTHANSGIYFNGSYVIPNPSHVPYSLKVNLTINSKTYNKTTKILVYNKNQVPKIHNLIVDSTEISRATDNSTNITAELDKPSYGDINAYLSIYSYSFFNSKKSINKTISLSHGAANFYTETFNPNPLDPSGHGIFYIIPENLNYVNPTSPRYVFQIKNNPPEIEESLSYFNYGGNSDIAFEDTENDDGSSVYPTSQGVRFNFRVNVRDSVIYEEASGTMRVFVNLLVVLVTEDSFIVVIPPKTYAFSELTYYAPSNIFIGNFTIPDTMSYSSISGTKSIATAASYNDATKEGYLGILVITVYDSEGSSEDFVIILSISGGMVDVNIIITIIFAVIGLIALSSISLYYIRRRKRRGTVQQTYDAYSIQPYYEEQNYDYVTPSEGDQFDYAFFCPFCGKGIKSLKKFCPHCGESMENFTT
jgi:subtilisin family serine protease